MVRRKGELSGAQVNRLYSHQVAVPPPTCDRERFHRYDRMLAFVRDYGIRQSPIGFAVHHAGERWDVHAFADRAEAEAFRLAFDGAWCHPQDRGTGRNWARWERRGEPPPG
jgi:hypothetical protein